MNSFNLNAFNANLYVCLICLIWSNSQLDESFGLGLKLQKGPKVVVNEIMFRVSADYSEFVELYNVSGFSIELNNLYIQIGDGSLKQLSKQKLELQDRSFYLIAADKLLVLNLYPNVIESDVSNEKLPALRDSGNRIILWYLDDHEQMSKLDEVHYDPDWHLDNLASDRNISLERIDPFRKSDASNWSSSLDRSYNATPTERNSILYESTIANSIVVEYSEVISPNADGNQDDFWVLVKTPDLRTRMTIEILNTEGRKINELARNQAIVFEEQIQWREVSELSDGHYFMRIHVVSDDGLSHTELKPFAIIR